MEVNSSKVKGAQRIMTVRKAKSGWKVVHCHGSKRGKTIAKHKTKKKAMAQHRAIQASKARRRGR